MSDTMQAIAWLGPEQLALVERPVPRVEHDEDAIVRVSHASTCGTDLHIYRGAVPGFEPGTVIGHEFVGTIATCGTAVRRHVPGQRVRGADFAACGRCTACRAGRHAQCPTRRLFGFSGLQPRLDGALAGFVRVPHADTTLQPLAPEADARLGLLGADVAPTAWQALERAGVAAGQRVAVVGAGPVGAMCAHFALDRGAEPLLLETRPPRRAHARALGLAAEDDAPEGGFDVAVDAVGGETGLRRALALVRAGGSVVGVGSQAGTFALDWGRVFQRETSLHFVIGNPLREDADAAAALARCRGLLDRLFPDSLALAEVPEYFASLLRRERFKAVVAVQAP